MGFSLFLLLLITPSSVCTLFELHAEPANFEEVVAEWEQRGVRVWDLGLFFFFFNFLISTFSPTLAATTAASYLFLGSRALQAAEG